MWNMHDFYWCRVKQKSDCLHHGSGGVRLDADSKFTKQDQMRSRKKQRPHTSALCSTEQKTKVHSALKCITAILGLRCARHAGIRIIRRFKKSRCEWNMHRCVCMTLNKNLCSSAVCCWWPCSIYKICSIKCMQRFWLMFEDIEIIFFEEN